MKNAVTEKLIKAVKAARPAPRAAEIDFLRGYYHRLSGQDFSAGKAAALRAAALRHRKLGAARAPGETLIEAYNLQDARGGPAADRDETVINIISDDKPFIIDSLTIKLNAMRKTPHRIAHPIFEVERDARGRMRGMTPFAGKARRDGAPIETYVQFRIDFTRRAEHAHLLRELHGVMSDIEIVVADWARMRANTLLLAEMVAARKGGGGLAKISGMRREHDELLRWLEDHNFAFLGYAEVEVADGARASLDRKSALGVLRAAARRDGDAAALDMLPDAECSAASPLVFAKSRRRAHIHRANYFDCIMIAHGGAGNGNGKGKRRVSCILGFLAGRSALLPTGEIPHLRNKTAYILKESALRPGGHAHKTLQTTLETLPRELLFQMDTRSLYALCMTILNHLERRKTRAHLHRNITGHFYSCLVYIPRDLFNSKLRARIQEYLGAALGADEVTFNVYFSDSILTRIHYLAHRHDRSEGKADAAAIERRIRSMARDWNENLFEALREQHGYQFAGEMLELYRDAFPGSYRDDFSVERAVADIGRFAAARAGPGEICAALEPARGGNDARAASFKLYAGDDSVALSDVLPILRHMGVRVLNERPYRVARRDGVTVWLHDFSLTRKDGREFDIAACAENFESVFLRAWRGEIEDDGFNRLALLAGLGWKEVSLLRAYFRYLKQIRLRYSEQYIMDALANYPDLAVAVVAFFKSRFDPSAKRARAKSAEAEMERKLDGIATLDEDRILRALIDVVRATVRTNYYQTGAGGESKPCIALKLRPREIPRIPEPAPLHEIFVCSPRVEGVHLRGGAVARGGLRWSERLEDFRTEVLGLVKAQRVKNAVIVPVGSKGGFVAKRLPAAGREEIRREVIACYRLFIGGMLDLTDNLGGSRVIPPKNVVRLDGDDPYLVVAADKGTATFSDIANAISEEHGFWLGDAFASGGSAGYDHKKMGITARGAWESVKRHFRELGKDIQKTDFTAAGIGDMAGDVFGNGMLLSKHIRLVAAFNHMHIFIDPSPDAARSFRERRRLFNLPGSSWSDYDRAALSKGGGVFERTAKSIALSPEARKMLGAPKDRIAPDDLISLILKAEVELLWNGGIGTYVKASGETHAEVQDKANDGVRADASELRCKVVGEGGNLGMTQLARVEFASRGGLCYTDAIDNSAGVDTSDREVNIKILLNAAIAAKKLAPAGRNRLLASMEKEIAALVLRNNYQQTQTLGMEAARAPRRMQQYAHALGALEADGLLSRAIEFLPDAAAIEERRETGKWLTRPELAVLLSYAKMDLYQALLDSKLPDDPYLRGELERYFPQLLSKKYPAQMRAHRLRREIIATRVTNDLVGVMGPTFHLRLADLAGSDATEVTRAYIAARDILDAPALIRGVEELDNQIAARAQMEMLAHIAAALESCVVGLLREPSADIGARVSALRPGCAKLKSVLKSALGRGAAAAGESEKKFTEAGAPPALARQLAALPALGHAADIIDIANRRKRPLEKAAHVYFRARETFGINWLEQAIDALPADSDWRQRAQFRLGADLRAAHSAITHAALAQKGADAGAVIARWLSANRAAASAAEKMRAALKTEYAPDFAMLSVLVGELRGCIGASHSRARPR